MDSKGWCRFRSCGESICSYVAVRKERVADSKKAEAPVDETAVQMKEIKESGLVAGGEAVVKELQKRKLIQHK